MTLLGRAWLRAVRVGLVNPTVQTWLANIGAGALLAQIAPGLPVALRILFGVMTLICGVLGFPHIWERLQNLSKFLLGSLKNAWPFLLVLAMGIASILILDNLFKPTLPPDVLKARRDIAEVQYALSGIQVKRWWITDDPSKEPREMYVARGYEILVVEPVAPQDQTLKTYIKNGQRLAEDSRGPEPYALSRRYYREDCAFATDYFDSSGRFALLAYDKDCRGKPKIFDVGSPVFLSGSPAFSPPVSVFMYHR